VDSNINADYCSDFIRQTGTPAFGLSVYRRALLFVYRAISLVDKATEIHRSSIGSTPISYPKKLAHRIEQSTNHRSVTGSIPVL
jgi:hypothetical protein